MSTASFYKWRAKYGGHDAIDDQPDEVSETQNAAEENVLPDEHAGGIAFKEALGKKIDAAISTPRRCGEKSQGVAGD